MRRTEMVSNSLLLAAVALIRVCCFGRPSEPANPDCRVLEGSSNHSTSSGCCGNQATRCSSQPAPTRKHCGEQISNDRRCRSNRRGPPLKQPTRVRRLSVDGVQASILMAWRLSVAPLAWRFNKTSKLCSHELHCERQRVWGVLGWRYG